MAHEFGDIIIVVSILGPSIVYLESFEIQQVLNIGAVLNILRHATQGRWEKSWIFPIGL